jgi:hypothetical protein
MFTPLEHFLNQQIQEAGAAIRATWDAINNIVKHFFVVNAILIGFTGVVWTENVKQLTEITKKTQEQQDYCKQQSSETSIANKSPAEAFKVGQDNALKCRKYDDGIFNSPHFIWLATLNLIGIFGILSNIFAVFALKRIGPGYGQTFLDAAAEAEKQLTGLLTNNTNTSTFGVYSSMKTVAENYKNKSFFKAGIIVPSYFLFVIVNVFWIVMLVFAWRAH